MVCDILWPLHQLLDVFWCLKCFESGLPGTGDTGRKNHHQSPGCQRGRHSILAFWDSSCPLRSCSVTFHVSASRGWLTRPEVVRRHKQVVFYFIFNMKLFFFPPHEANVILKFHVQAVQMKLVCIYWKKGNTYCVRQDPTWIKSSKPFIQGGITSIDITQLCFPRTLSPSTNRTWS